MITLAISAQYLAAVLLVGIAVYALFVLNDIHGACPRFVAWSWVGLLVTPPWLASSLVLADWRQCMPVALCAFAMALLAVFLLDRYGRARKVRP